MSTSITAHAELDSVSRARRLLWLAFGICVLTLIVGRAWDSYWHTTQPFDDFFSPPHIFIYLMTSLNIVVVAFMIANEDTRRSFGTGIEVRLLPFQVPGGLIIVMLAFAILSFAGLVLDNLWHSSFGLDETVWSFPHALLGWMWLLCILGFISCFIALNRPRSMNQYTALFLALIVLGFSVSPMLGPLFQRTSPLTTQAIAQIPVLKDQLDAQHMLQIYQKWNLNRTNPLLIPLGAFWIGAASAFIRQMNPRMRILLTACFFWTLITLLGDRATAQRLDTLLRGSDAPISWLPLPILPAAIVYGVLVKINGHERWAWTFAGGIFGLYVLFFFFWGRPIGESEALLQSGLFAIFAPLLTGIGARMGTWIYRIVEQPTRAGIVKLFLVCIAVSMVLGTIDLYLRWHT